jgi:hypothetical protein
VEFLESLRAHSPARLHPPIDKLTAVLLSNPPQIPPEAAANTVEASVPRLQLSRSSEVAGHRPWKSAERSSNLAHANRNQDGSLDSDPNGQSRNYSKSPTQQLVAGVRDKSQDGLSTGAPLSKRQISRTEAQPAPTGKPAPCRRIHRGPVSSKAAEEPLPGLWLPEVPLRASDDQYLFEINLKLQCTGDPRVVRVALRELCEHAVHDLPPEALLQKHNILENALSLAHPVGSTGDLDLAALGFVALLVRKIKGALSLAADPSFQVHLEDDQPSTSGSNSNGSNLKHPASFLRSTYPIAKRAKMSKPEFPVPRREGRLLGERVVDVSQHVHTMVMHLLKLLGQERRLEKTVPLLRELLPLLQLTMDTPGETLDTKVRHRRLLLSELLGFRVWLSWPAFEQLVVYTKARLAHGSSRIVWFWLLLPRPPVCLVLHDLAQTICDRTIWNRTPNRRHHRGPLLHYVARY